MKGNNMNTECKVSNAFRRSVPYSLTIEQMESHLAAARLQCLSAFSPLFPYRNRNGGNRNQW